MQTLRGCGIKYAALRTSVLSRTGFVITFCNCPVTWSSKLQTEIVLSTMMSEYIALSTATHELLPLRRFLKDIASFSFINIPTASFQSHINTICLQPSQEFDDNTACTVLSTTESNFKPRTKHISIKWHHFHDQVRNGNLQIIKVPSESNWADIFTKPLTKVKFQKLRFLMIIFFSQVPSLSVLLLRTSQSVLKLLF